MSETKLTLRNVFILDLFAIGDEKESEDNERTTFWRPHAETLSLLRHIYTSIIGLI